MSVIIPVAEGENQHLKLVGHLPEAFQVIIAQEQGRAASLNFGASQARGRYLWFLHADSRITPAAISRLIKVLQASTDTNVLWYFDLEFYDGPARLMRLTALGVWWRCRLFKTPFGDQGLVVARSTFERSGGFPLDVIHGEDHVWLLHLRRLGVKIRPLHALLATSGRKYVRYGWWQTTWRHQGIWLGQVWQEARSRRCKD